MTTAQYAAHVASHPDLHDHDAGLAEEAALAMDMRVVEGGTAETGCGDWRPFPKPWRNADQCRALERAVREATGWMVGIDTWTGKGDVMWFDADGSGIEPSQQTWTDDNDLPARARAALLAMRAWHTEQEKA